ncbi:MAG: TerC family protein [Bacteroidia bacterium]|nr:TerC family protein [Bacteroidia bacterium]MDW8346006.1 TerC family protein [Bacteroidia bacterium]
MTTEHLISLFSLTLMEITLCIDNAIFISITASRIPNLKQQQRTRFLGILISLIMNILMISLIGFLKGLDYELFIIFEHGFSGKELIMLCGGFFLISNSVREMHHKLEGDEEEQEKDKVQNMGKALLTIFLMNFVFSLDSVLAAMGMARETWIMITSIFIALTVMFFFARPIGKFVEKHPTTKMLALAFLLLIGFTLVVDGFGVHLEKGYVYSAMIFSLFVEFLNLRLKKSKTPPVRLREPRMPENNLPKIETKSRAEV